MGQETAFQHNLFGENKKRTKCESYIHAQPTDEEEIK